MADELGVPPPTPTPCDDGLQLRFVQASYTDAGDDDSHHVNTDHHPPDSNTARPVDTDDLLQTATTTDVRWQKQLLAVYVEAVFVVASS